MTGVGTETSRFSKGGLSRLFASLITEKIIIFYQLTIKLEPIMVFLTF